MKYFYVFQRVRVIPNFKRLFTFSLIFLVLLFTLPLVSAQVNTGGNANTSNHTKQIVGYITNWDAWKATNAGLPAQGALTHLNIDYSKYTILNYSFFGVAVDGSLHSGDLRNKNIYQSGVNQEPGDILFTDIYSSWDFHILFGEIEAVHHINESIKLRAESFGYQVEVGGSTWTHPGWGLSGGLPLPLPAEGGAPGLLDLAHQNGVKVMASIGGWSMCKHFPEMAADPVKRSTFIADCQKLMNMGFDGIDLDWEYPGPYHGMNFQGTQVDFENFKTLVQEIRNAIGPDKLITAAFSADPNKLQGFDWPALSSTMDYFNMMSYDFNGGWSNIAGHNAPLYTYDGAEAPNFNWQSTHNALIALGVPSAKINMGAPFYGRGVVTNGTAGLNAATLKRQETVQPDGPITTSADFTNWPKDVYDGTPNYYYVKQQALSANSGWTEHWDDQAKVPYLTKDNFFLSYDNVQSIGMKAQYIVDNNLAGTIIWTVFGDLEISGTVENFGTKLKRWSNVDSELINKMNEVFANGGGGNPTNQPPVVSILAPSGGTSFAEGAVIQIDAQASDTDGTVTKVEFFEGANKLGEDITSPYGFTWNGATVGDHQLTARATDNDNAPTTSAAIQISVIGDTTGTAPTIAITTPVNGQELETSVLTTLTAQATDSDGTIVSVVFHVDGQQLETNASGNLYSASWTPTADGNYVITATATDNDGLESSVQISVSAATPTGGCTAPVWDAGTIYTGGDQVSHNGHQYQANWWTQGDNPATNSGQWQVWTDLGPCDGGNTNQDPSVSITSPLDGASITEGTISIDVNAIDQDGSVANVEFFIDGSKVGDDTTSPYGLDHVFVPGSYALTAVATDNEGASATSSIINITVTQTGGNTSPTVSITAPASGSSYVVGETVALSADASDSDGSVALVEFYINGTKIGEDATAPYDISWIALEGSAAITATATDNENASTTSAAVNITVNPDGGSCIAPQYIENGGYDAGSQVQNNGTLYQCKEFPFSGWCNGQAWAYAPGTGTVWQDAWIEVGPCDGGNPPGNVAPTVSITSPSVGSSFTPGQSVNIQATAADSDGTVTLVEFFVNGSKVGDDASSPYAFAWSATLGNHTLTARATDDQGATTDADGVSISVSSITPPPGGSLPDRVLVGYWHNFINGAGPMKLNEISSDWDVINISFAEPTVPVGSTMAFAPTNDIYPNAQEFKDHVAQLQAAGKKVLISLGGANGAIHLDDAADAVAYSTSMINIITEYGFDGLDIDLEGSSLSLIPGDSDFRNPTSPKIVNFINGTQTILSHFGPDFILTAAPETLYVQGGITGYGGSTGAYLPVIYAFKERLNYIHVQHYNTGCMLGLGQNSPCYQQGTADFQVAMAEMLLAGFPVPGHSQGFPALRQDQVAIGLPASPQAAGGGYTAPQTVHQALNYLIHGQSYGGNYTLQNPSGYPNFRGLMTWSINWDQYYNFEYSSNHRPYLDGLSSARTISKEVEIAEETGILRLYPNPFNEVVQLQISINQERTVSLDVFNQLGAKVAELIPDQSFGRGAYTIDWRTQDLPKGIYLFRLTNGNEQQVIKMIKK